MSKSIENNFYRVLLDGIVVSWSSLLVKCDRSSLADIVIYGNKPRRSAIVIVECKGKKIFTGTVQRCDESAKNQYSIVAYSDSYKIPHAVKPMSFRNAYVPLILNEIASDVGIHADSSKVPNVQLKHFSVGKGDTLGAVLISLKQALSHVGEIQWFWDFNNVLQFGVLSNFRGRRIDILEKNIIHKGIHEYEIVPQVILYNDLIAYDGWGEKRINYIIYDMVPGKRNSMRLAMSSSN